MLERVGLYHVYPTQILYFKDILFKILCRVQYTRINIEVITVVKRLIPSLKLAYHFNKANSDKIVILKNVIDIFLTM